MNATPNRAQDPDYLPFDPAPSRPVFTMPEGAIDAHCHVFGPASRFPFAPERKYTPVDASAEQLFALRDHLGISRNVIVQATCHGTDNSAMLDAIAKSAGRARGVAVIDEYIEEDQLQLLHAGGVRAVRFNFLKRLVGDAPLDRYRKIAERVAALGWHIVVYFESHELESLRSHLVALPGIVVIDHMGCPEVRAGIEDDGFRSVCRLMDENSRFWIKVSCPERFSRSGPPYNDVVPFARRLINGYPDRVLWGTDWPHPNMRTHMPDDGALVNLISQIAANPVLQRALLIENPLRLYWPEEMV